jgi:transcriptional/translational regulatory protein YebC/TACO1
MFERVGQIVYPLDVASGEAMFEAAAEAGASNVETGGEGHEITCAPDDFSSVRDALAESFGDPAEAALTWKPQTTAPIDEDQAQSLFKLLDILDDNDDVQRVAANYEISDEIMTRLTA